MSNRDGSARFRDGAETPPPALSSDTPNQGSQTNQTALTDKIRDAIDDVIGIFNPPSAATAPENKPAAPAAEAPQHETGTRANESEKSVLPPPPPPAQPITAPGTSAPPRPIKKRKESKADLDGLGTAGGGEEPEPVDDNIDMDELIVAEEEAAPPSAPAPVMFSAYPPKAARRDEWQPLLAYVFRETAAQAVIADALHQLGDKQMGKSVVTIKGKVPVAEGAEVVARPVMPGFQFKPLEIKVGFYDEWQRFNFELRAKDAPLNQFATGSITFTVEGLIVGDVPLSVYVGDENATGEISSAVTRMYQSIFCSYSHDDTKIVERVERAYKALGLDYLRDITTLKSGTEWSEELLKLIDRADIFQLFWSQAAADSPYVKQEWQHALKLESNKNGFIRPVYWTQPIPAVPGELRHIHFAYQPDLDD
ncbi:MAG: toll/interleukin-1 receptor domain-containing protein [Anaerolineae bacterium]